MVSLTIVSKKDIALILYNIVKTVIVEKKNSFCQSEKKNLFHFSFFGQRIFVQESCFLIEYISSYKNFAKTFVDSYTREFFFIILKIVEKRLEI